MAKMIMEILVVLLFFGYFLPKFMNAVEALLRISRALPHILHMLHWIMRYQARALNSSSEESEPDWDSIIAGTERNKTHGKTTDNLKI